MQRIIWLFILSMVLTGCSESRDNEMPEASADREIVSEETAETVTGEAVAEVDVEGEVAEKSERKTVSVDTPLIFSIQTIDEAMAAYMTGKSYHENPHVDLEDLRYIQTGYYGFDGKVHQGAIVVHKVIAEDVLDIFIELYDEQYPIERLEPIDAYGGSDPDSMVANNSSAFNYRLVSGTDKLSNHAYGLAIDINPLVNPWVSSGGSVDPEEGMAYIDRTLDQQGMIKVGDACYNAFVSRGFSWGGDWNNSKDYQHFDIKVIGIND